MENTLNTVKWLSAGASYVLTYFFGGADVALCLLLALITIDYITGVIAACVEKRLSSDIGFRGIAKKVGTLLIVAVAHLVGTYLSIDIRAIVIGYYIANEGISVLENTSKIGVPYPEKLLRILQQLKSGEDK